MRGVKFWAAVGGELAGATALAVAVVGGPFWVVVLLFAVCLATVRLWRRA